MARTGARVTEVKEGGSIVVNWNGRFRRAVFRMYVVPWCCSRAFPHTVVNGQEPLQPKF